MMPVWFFKWVLILVIGVCGVGCSKKEEKGIRFAVIERADVAQRTTLNGTVRGIRQSQVQPGYAGYIAKYFVKVGDAVKPGQPLVSLTQTLNQSLSEVFPIQAPFAGTVTQILKREGEYVSTTGTSNTLLIMDDMTQMWIDTNIPEVDVAKVSLGLECLIKANALQGKTYKGVVQTLSLSSKQSTDRWDRGRVEFPAEIRILDGDKDLKPGMTAVIDVISAKVEGVLTIRHDFVQREKDKIFLVDDKDQRHEIEIGLSNEEVIESRKGGIEGLKVQMKDFTKL